MRRFIACVFIAALAACDSGTEEEVTMDEHRLSVLSAHQVLSTTDTSAEYWGSSMTIYGFFGDGKTTNFPYLEFQLHCQCAPGEEMWTDEWVFGSGMAWGYYRTGKDTNIISYENLEGPEQKIVITEFDKENRTISGTFQVTMGLARNGLVLPGGAKIEFKHGSFYKIHYVKLF